MPLLKPCRINGWVSAGCLLRGDQSPLCFPPLCLASWLSLRQLLPLRSAAAHRLFFCHLSTLSLSVGGGWLWRAPAALPSPRDGFSRAHLWPQVICGQKNGSCWIFGFAPKQTCLSRHHFLKLSVFMPNYCFYILNHWTAPQRTCGSSGGVRWLHSPSQSDCIPSMVR